MTDPAIRPFEVHVPDEDLADLRRHLAATRWPSNIALYWLTGTGASAVRLYWEGGQAAARAAGQVVGR
jgi:hypothetical protein